MKIYEDTVLNPNTHTNFATLKQQNNPEKYYMMIASDEEYHKDQ